jgi:hypothetical protein
MIAARLLYSTDDQSKELPPRRRRRRVNWPLAEAKLWLTLPHPGGHGGEAALVIDGGRHSDRNRGGTDQDESYHGEVSIFDPSVQAIFMPYSGIPDHPEEGSRPGEACATLVKTPRTTPSTDSVPRRRVQ